MGCTPVPGIQCTPVSRAFRERRASSNSPFSYFSVGFFWYYFFFLFFVYPADSFSTAICFSCLGRRIVIRSSSAENCSVIRVTWIVYRSGGKSDSSEVLSNNYLLLLFYFIFYKIIIRYYIIL